MSTLEIGLITAIALVTLVSAVMVVGSTNLVHAGFWMLPFVAGIGGIYLGLGATFLFALQLLVYAGAVVTLILFVLFLTQGAASAVTVRGRYLGPGVALAIATVAVIGVAMFRTNPDVPMPIPAVRADLTEEIGRQLIGPYVLPFEVTSVLLLSALVGALFVAKTPRRKPVAPVDGAPVEVAPAALEPERELEGSGKR